MNKKEPLSKGLTERVGTDMSGSFRLDEWMDSLDESLLDNIPMEEMAMTEQEISRLQKSTMKKIKARPRLGKKRVLLLAAAMVTATVTLSAVAAGSLNGGALFSRYFGGEDLQAGWLQKMCSEPIASSTADGYQIDVLGVMGDRKSFNVIFDLTAPEGQILSDTVRFETPRLAFDGETGGYSMGWTVNQLEDEDPADNKARFMLSADADKKLVGKNVTLKLETLQESSETAQSDVYEESILSDASWSLTFPLDFEDLTRTVRVNQKASWKGESVQIKSIEISPIAMRVNLALPLQRAISGLFGGVGNMDSVAAPIPSEAPFAGTEGTAPDDYQIEFRMKDGSVIGKEDLAMMCGDSRNGAGWIVSWNFWQLIDISEVESVTVMGKEISLR